VGKSLNLHEFIKFSLKSQKNDFFNVGLTIRVKLKSFRLSLTPGITRVLGSSEGSIGHWLRVIHAAKRLAVPMARLEMKKISSHFPAAWIHWVRISDTKNKDHGKLTIQGIVIIFVYGFANSPS
jgi:hypothetical protein